MRHLVEAQRFLTAVAIGMLLWVGTASAQTLDVPVQWIPDGQSAGCGGSSVTGLDPNGDNFLAVRSWPGTDYRKIDELHTGDQVRACEFQGNWVGIYYGPESNRQSGWVHRRYLTETAG